MNIDDFRYMWRGKRLKTLSPKEAHLLHPINIHGKGTKRALLLLHGFSSSPAVFRQLAPAIAPTYDAIISPTLPGHGNSLDAFAKAKALDWITAAEEACQELVKKYHKVDVLGLSLGGLLACHLSQKMTLNHLYLLAPALALQVNVPWALKIAQILRKLGFSYLRNRAGNLHSEVHSEIAYRQLPITTLIEILTLVNEFKFMPPNCPTDLFLGRFDQTVSSNKVAERLADLPNITTHWLEKSAHVLPLDGDIDTIITCIKNNFSAAPKLTT